MGRNNAVSIPRYGGAANNEPAAAEQLAAARAALLDGTVRQLQIRYCWQETLWIDTLKTESDGYHLVRIAHRQR